MTLPDEVVLPEPSIPDGDGSRSVPLDWSAPVPERALRSLEDLPKPEGEPARRPDAMSEVFENADGTESIAVHAEPVNYRPAGSTTWKKIENQLVPDPARPGWVRNKANSWTVAFGPINPGGLGGVELTTAKGMVRAAPERRGLFPVLPAVGEGDEADTVTYRNVWPGVDVVYTVTGARVKEDIVVRGGARAEFPFVVQGLGLVEQAPVAVGGDELPKLGRLPKVTGAQLDTVSFGGLDVAGSDGEFTLEAGATAGVEAHGGGRGVPRDAQRLVVSVDESWLADEADGDHPVVVDPTFNIGPSGACAYFDGDDNPTTLCDGAVRTGTHMPDTGHHWWRSVATFNYRPAVEGKEVLGAQIWGNTAVYPTEPASDPELVKVYGATGWSFGQATTYFQDLDVADEAPCYWGHPWDVCMDVTGAVQSWALQGHMGGTWPEGLIGFGPDEDDWPRFLQEYTYKRFDPSGLVLFLNVNTIPTAPPLVTPANGSLAIDTLTPTLKWNASTDGDGDPLKYNARISTHPSGDAGLVATSPDITGAGEMSWTVPEGVLRDGVTYYWKVYANDAKAWRPSDVRKLTVDRRLGLGGLSPTDPFAGVSTNLVTGNAQLSVPAPRLPSVGGGMGAEFVYNGQEPRQGLTGSYWEDKDQDGIVDNDDPLKLVRTDPQVQFDWGEGAPSPAVPVDHFISKWVGTVRTPAGDWQFGATSDDSTKVWIDGTEVLSTGLTSTPIYENDRHNGIHKIQLDYVENSAPAHVTLYARNADDHDQAFPVPADWFTPDTPEMPAGWSLQASDITAVYTRAEVREGSVTLVGNDGSTYAYKQNADGRYAPPEGTDDELTVNPTGTVTVRDDMGYIYTFLPSGKLDSVTTALDDRRLATSEHTYDGHARLTKMRDPVSNREVRLIYASSPTDPACPLGQPGFGSGYAPSPGMLCQVEYWDPSSGQNDPAELIYATELYYKKPSPTSPSLLMHIRNPGDLWWGFGYDSEGRVVQVLDPKSWDAVWQGGWTAGYDKLDTEITYTGTGHKSRVNTVTSPAANQAATERPQRSYGYAPNAPDGILVDGSATVTRAGMAGTYRHVKYDMRGRAKEETNAVGKITKTSWDQHDLQVATETPDNLLQTTVYDNRFQPKETWGPAPKDWFFWAFDMYPIPKEEHKANIPHTTTRYDEGLNGLQATFWNNIYADGPPVSHQFASGDMLFDWNGGSPAGINNDNFSGRWTGDLVFPGQGSYKFRLYVEDIGTVYINNEKKSEGGGGNTPEFTVDIGVWSPLIQPLRIDMLETTGDAAVELEWWTPGASDWATVPGSVLQPGYHLATSTTDADGKTTKTEYTDSTKGIGPQHALATKTIVDPGGLNLTSTTTYEAATGSGGFLRPVEATLPSGAGSKTTKIWYGGTEHRDNPCTTASDPANQGGMLKFDTSADPDAGGTQTPIVRETVYDKKARVVAYRTGSGTLTDTDWICTTYDARSRETEVKFPAFGGQLARTVTSNYKADPDGSGPRGVSPFVTALTDSAGTITSEIDMLERTVLYTDVFDKTTTFTFDNLGRETGSSGPAGAIAKGYDAADRLTSLSRGGQALAEAFVYDDASRLRSVTYPAGTNKAGNNTKGTFDYDTTYGRLTKVTWSGASGTPVITSDEVQRSLGSDVVGEITDNFDHHAGVDYTYDLAGRLVDAWVPGRRVQYSYASTAGCTAPDAFKNTNRSSMTVTPTGGAATTTNYCYNHADRLISATDTAVGSIAYDAHGNATSIFTEAHSYDAADRHVRTVKGPTTVDYVRDATDRIVERKVNSQTSALYGSTGSGDAPGFTMDATKAVVEVTFSLPGGAMLTTRAAGNVWSYPNIHGDVAAVANQAGAKQGVTSVYDPFGNLVSGTLPDNSQGNLDYGWLGEYQRPLEHEATLQPVVEMGQRQYSPLLGRFLEVDPIEGGSANDYDYVNGDPVNDRDLNGTRAKKPKAKKKGKYNIYIRTGWTTNTIYITRSQTKKYLRWMNEYGISATTIATAICAVYAPGPAKAACLFIPPLMAGIKIWLQKAANANSCATIKIGLSWDVAGAKLSNSNSRYCYTNPSTLFIGSS